MRVTAVLLAAGSSLRYPSDKLLEPYRGRPLFRHALDALARCPRIASTVLVIRPRFPLPEPLPGVTVVVNQEHEEGMGASLRAGILAAPDDTDAYLVALADMPDISPALIDALLAFAEQSPRPIVVPVCGGRRGHPVSIHADLRGRLLRIRGDQGARELVRDHPDLVDSFETEDPAVLFDVDLPGDLEGRP
jgi:molybdenum cofactor cytidylyltransferase